MHPLHKAMLDRTAFHVVLMVLLVLIFLVSVAQAVQYGKTVRRIKAAVDVDLRGKDAATQKWSENDLSAAQWRLALNVTVCILAVSGTAMAATLWIDE